MLPGLPSAKQLLGGTGYGSNRFRQALAVGGIEPRVPQKSQGPDPSRPGPRPLAARHRKHVRLPEGLAPHAQALRPIRTYLHVCCPSGRHRLFWSVSSKPGLRGRAASVATRTVRMILIPSFGGRC
jgi:hypothetical protein